MRHIHKYKNTLLEEFYLGEDDLTIYRAKDGYHGRFKKGDVAKTYQSGSLKNFYDMVHIPKTRKSIKVAYLLCLLRNTPLPKNPVIDHINGDTTDNRRENLRIVNQQINSCNRCKRSDNTSGITGIHWSEYHQHYVIRKTVKGKRLSRSRKTLQEAKQVLKELHNMDRTYTKRHGK
jgi:hypothetical protein